MSPSYVCRDLFLKLIESLLVSPFLKDFLPKPPGLHTTAREPKFHEKTPQEREERKKIVAGEGNKFEILGFPAEGGLAEGGPAEGGPVEGGPAEGGPVESDPTKGGPAEGSGGGRSWGGRSFLGRAALPGEGCCGGLKGVSQHWPNIEIGSKH